MKQLMGLMAMLCCSFLANAQVKVELGNTADITFKKQPKVSSFVAGDKYYFIFKTSEGYNHTFNLAVADKDGHMDYPGEIKFNVGAFNNSFEINAFQAVGNKMLALVENRDKKAGQNRLTLKTVDERGALSATGTEIGSIAYEKMMKPGTWYSAVSPDKKHLAIVAQMPFDKGQPNHFQYYFLDENLKVVQTGKFDMQHEKELRFHSFYTSDKGDFYFITDDFDKSYRYPIVYKAKAGSTETSVMPATLPEGSAKNLSYTASVNPNGDLLVAGYYQPKAAVVIGDVQAKGSWVMNT
ncbi:MAG: hypothetical protein K0Q66_2408, partial [Chitinophagaceae bacterium]|nr:hypothetical protein [Chitinophagaceae bacterium]